MYMDEREFAGEANKQPRFKNKRTREQETKRQTRSKSTTVLAPLSVKFLWTASRIGRVTPRADAPLVAVRKSTVQLQQALDSADPRRRKCIRTPLKDHAGQGWIRFYIPETMQCDGDTTPDEIGS